MEQRHHPRVQIPFEIELKHSTIGTLKTVARDVSEGGLFVPMTKTSLTRGAKLEVTLIGLPLIESRATPTVKMEVARVTDEGIGLSFVNKTSHHLWQSVKRLRQELAIGRDYFQVHQSALIVDEDDRCLVVQQNGRWLFPGAYLIVGEDWQTSLLATAQRLSIESATIIQPLNVNSPQRHASEAALFTVFYLLRCPNQKVKLDKTSPHSSAKWISRPREIADLTFSDEYLRQYLQAALRAVAIDSN